MVSQGSLNITRENEIEKLLLTGPEGGTGHASRGNPGRSRQCSRQRASLAGLGEHAFLGGFWWNALELLEQGQSGQFKLKGEVGFGNLNVFWAIL